MKIVFTDQLNKPSCWAYICEKYFGTYGPVKHQWLIEQTGEKWDDTYLSTVLGFTNKTVAAGSTNSNYDIGYCTYFSQMLSLRLDVYNAERISQGQDVLKEADGNIVTLINY